MIRGTNRIFSGGIVLSFLIHAAALGIVSFRASARQEAPRQLEFVAVEFKEVAAPVQVQRPKLPPPPPPEADPAPVESKPATAQAVVARLLRTEPSPRPAASGGRSTLPVKPAPNVRRTAQATGVKGTPRSGGGELDLGNHSTGGDFSAGPGGRTPSGWVPGTGSGKGAGTGPGTGNAAPIGTGSITAPVAPAPAPPRNVSLRVCTISGLRPNSHCKSTASRTFREGAEPHGTCTACKAPPPPPKPKPEPPRPEPAPSHVSSSAEVVKAKFLSGSTPQVNVRLTKHTTVTVQYTVRADGAVGNVQVTAGSGQKALDQSVVRAVQSYRYSPAKQGGIPREVQMKRTFAFEPN